MPDADLPRDKWWRSLIFNLMLPVVGYIIGKKATHWGKIHSISFGLCLSIIFSIILSVFIIDTNIITILSLSFFGGYVFHLIVDQWYHEIRSKRDGPVALKIFWNTNKDPLVWFFRHI